LATIEKHAPEEYNTYLHELGFRPASILNRIDAVCCALLFMRAKRLGGCQDVNFLDILDTIRSIKTQLQREKRNVELKKVTEARE
jgi:hypothetical protein